MTFGEKISKKKKKRTKSAKSFNDSAIAVKIFHEALGLRSKIDNLQDFHETESFSNTFPDHKHILYKLIIKLVL